MSLIINNKVCDTEAEALEQLRKMVHGLLPDWRNPERFFERRSEISGALTRLLRLGLPGGGERGRARERAPSHPEPSHLRVWPPAKSVQRLSGQALRQAEALFAPAAAPSKRSKRLPVTGKTTSRWRRRVHRYPRPPRNLNQGELL